MTKTTIETIMRRVGDLRITDAINIFRSEQGWQVSIKRPGPNTYGIGIDRHMDEAFRKAVSPPYGTPIETWLKLDEAADDDDDWRDLV